MKQLVLKVDVDTYRGTREGVPALVELFTAEAVGATFLFSLGKDHTGRAIKRVFRPGFFGKVKRTSVTEHYGYKTLLYGTLLPGPDIGRRCASTLRAVRDAGFECGVHTWDHVAWQDGVMSASAQWTHDQMAYAIDRFKEIFGAAPRVHGAAGWQMSVEALRLTQRLGFDYCSDGRGTTPFWPIAKGEPIRVPQYPTTLPTLDELLGLDGLTEKTVAARLLRETDTPKTSVQVYTLHAELEGQKLIPVLRELIRGWKAQGYTLCSLGDVHRAAQVADFDRCAVAWKEIPGRSGTLLVQDKVIASTH